MASFASSPTSGGARKHAWTKNEVYYGFEILNITIQYFLRYGYVFVIGPGVLACATRGGGQSEAGHCFHLLFLSFFSYAFCFSPTSEKLPWLK